MANKIEISFNNSMDKIKKEIKEIESIGYIAVGSYGHDFDMGNIYEYAYGDDADEVMSKHLEHLMNCER